MADIAWSEKRKALIPGKYENGFFVPFNGDDPIPAEKVVASMPPKTVKVTDDEGNVEEMTMLDAYKEGVRRQDEWWKTKGVWWIGGIVFALWILSMSNSRESKSSSIRTPYSSSTISRNAGLENELGLMDLTNGLSKLSGMSIEVIEAHGAKGSVDCASDKSLVASLRRVQSRTFPKSEEASFGVRTVPIAGGMAKLVGFERSFAPGDIGEVTTEQDFYVIGGDCRSLAL